MKTTNSFSVFLNVKSNVFIRNFFPQLKTYTFSIDLLRSSIVTLTDNSHHMERRKNSIKAKKKLENDDQ